MSNQYSKEQSIADLYYEELIKDASQSGSILMKLFCELYEHEPNRTDLVMFNDLVETYGKDRVFKTVLEIGHSVRPDKKNPRYLRAVLKRRLSESFQTEKEFEKRNININMDSYVEKRNEDLERAKSEEIVIPRIFEDE